MLKSAFSDDYPLAQLSVTLLIVLVCVILFSLLSLPVAYALFGKDALNFNVLIDENHLSLLRFYQVTQSIGLFVIPPFILSYIFTGSTSEYLRIRKAPMVKYAGIVIIIMILAIPVINLAGYLNSLIKFPQFMSGVENYLVKAENNAQKETGIFLSGQKLSDLFFNLFMIAIVPALGEELLFRGVLQRILVKLTRNVHWGIIIAGFVFSAVHMQFYGLFPRWMLGVLFGYMLAWSKNLWFPIIAHFTNNAIAVLTYYMVNTGRVSEKASEVGSGKEYLLSTIVAMLIMAGFIYLLYANLKREKGNQA